MRARLKPVLSEVDFVIAPTLPVPLPLRDAESITVGGRQMDFTMALSPIRLFSITLKTQ
jgi:hypothetical protein